MLSPTDFFDLSATAHTALFDDTTYVWDAISRIKPYVRSLLTTTHQPNSDSINVHPSTVIEGDVYIGENVTIAPGVYIQGPTVIEDNVEIRQGAFIRGDVLLAKGSLVGHATEAKQTILLENAHAPHFSYLGESILGRNSNLGAGTKLSNLPVNSVKNETTGKRPTIK
ncbi:MAG: glucose-1-phosphate thymidylyltransferase, partial [Chloroflexota bacterium]